MDKKVYCLEKDGRFWEVTVSVDGKNTIIRVGKTGYKGRTYPSKEHQSLAKSRQFALQHVNVKIMEGFTYVNGPLPSESLPTTYRKPMKKRSTVRRLARNDTINIKPHEEDQQNLAVSNELATQNTLKLAKPPWRKPHKKQSTIRRALRSNSSIPANTNAARTDTHTTSLSRQNTLPFSVDIVSPCI